MVLPRFLAELKHRNVYRAALVYAAVGWALLEAADVVLPRLGLPDWTVNLVLALVLLGFPIAMVFAWIFDFSPQGVARTEPISPDTHHHVSTASVVEFVVICVLVVTVGYLYVDRLSLQHRLAEPEIIVQQTPATPSPEQYRAIAVLPFADMSEAGDQAWFAEGIAEELLIALSRVDELNVMARTSSFAFKDTEKTVAEIAEILGVQAVLEGSVRRFRERVRISAQLVDAKTGFRLWSGSYERQITDIFQLQDELAKSVVEALRIELGVEPSLPLVSEQTRIPEAYNWFMRGRALFDWPNQQGALQSISYFKHAVEIDPNYATAWGYISYAYMIMMIYRPFSEVGPPAIAASERALALDTGQSEALAVKALMTQLVEHDWETAGHLYQQAIASNKSNNASRRAYALFFLQFIDRQAQAIELFSNTVRLDPLHAGRKASLAGLLLFAGNTQKAVQEARKALQLEPEHIIAITYLFTAYTSTNDSQALDSLLADMSPLLLDQPVIKALVGWNHAMRGNEKKARTIYRELLKSTESLTPIATINTSTLAFALGNMEEGLDLLEDVEKSGSWTQFWIKLLPAFDGPMREHPRYQALLKRMGLDDESVAALNERMSFD